METICGIIHQFCIYIQSPLIITNYSCCCCFYKDPVKNQIEQTIIHWNQTIPFIPPINQGQVIKVYDGDTITIASKLPYPESPLYRFSIRLFGIDSPEIKGKTTEEKEAAKKSQKALEDLILHKIIYLKDNAQEKYGRILANIYVDAPTNENPGNQIHINKWMLDNGYAYEYDGKTKKTFSSQFIN